MGGAQTRIAWLFLALIFLLQPANAYFAECFNESEPVRYWEGSSYWQGNRYVLNNFIVQILGYEFDSTAGSDSWGILIMENWELPSPYAGSSSHPIQTALDSLRSSLEVSGSDAASAHEISGNAQQCTTIYGLFRFALETNSQNPQSGYCYSSAKDYITDYSALFKSALAGSADAYVKANQIGRLAAAEADLNLEALILAGAASPEYSGGAKEAYLEAEAELSETGLCPRQLEGSQKVLSEFASRPLLPHTMPQSVSSYISVTVGAGGASSVARLSELSGSLEGALELMESEYQSEYAKAESSMAAVSKEIAEADAQDLDTMQDLPDISGGRGYAGNIRVGTEGIELARDSLVSQTANLAIAKSTHDSKGGGYLSESISSVRAISAGMDGSLASVTIALDDAREYEEAQKGLAQAAIDSADRAIGSSNAGIESKQHANALLGEARRLFGEAGNLATIGKRYNGYKAAMNATQEALAALSGTADFPLRDSVKKELLELRAFLDNAEKDGLNVDYERQKLDYYAQQLDGTTNPADYGTIRAGAENLRNSVAEKLLAMYGGLESDYASLRQLVDGLRAADPLSLPEFNRLSLSFPQGKLDVLSRAGQLKTLQADLFSLRQQAQEETKAALSAILSRNAQAAETLQAPILGEQTSYRAAISTYNPTSLSFFAPVQFSVPTMLDLYSSDSHSGDAIADAYPDKGEIRKTVISVPSVSAGQPFTIIFEKREQPAQLTSSTTSCSEATSRQAQAQQRLGFLAMRDIDSLTVRAQLPASADSATFSYKGISKAATLEPEGQSQAASAQISGIKAGTGEILVDYPVPFPFALGLSDASTEQLGEGRQRITYVATVSSQKLECGKAAISLSVPSAVQQLEVASLTGEKVSGKAATGTGSGSALSFSFEPLREGQEQSFAISYVLENSSDALKEAIESAEAIAKLFNRTADLQAIGAARTLASQNRTAEALAILSQLQENPDASSYPDYQKFASENSSAYSLLNSALAMQSSLAGENLTAASAQLSSITSVFVAAIEKAQSYSDSGKYRQGTDALRSAAAEFRESLSKLAWKSSSSASEAYAKARADAQGRHSGTLSSIGEQVALSQRQLSQAQHLESFRSSSLALSGIAEVRLLLEGDSADLKASMQRLAASFASLKAEAEGTLAEYSKQYSALTTQSQRGLPYKPADLQKAIQEAQKAMDKAAAAKEPTQQAFADANNSYTALSTIAGRLKSSLSSLEASASSGLGVARIALFQAKEKASGEDSDDIAAMERELGRAEEFLQEGLFSDSISSSDRVLSAASAIVDKRTAGGIDVRAGALGIISLLFIGGAAYYFWNSRKGEPRREKREIRKSDESSP